MCTVFFAKLLNSVWKNVQAEHNNKAIKECLRVALDKMVDAARLPPYGSVSKVTFSIGTAFSHSFQRYITDLDRRFQFELRFFMISTSRRLMLWLTRPSRRQTPKKGRR
jgi:hypothetical protein